MAWVSSTFNGNELLNNSRFSTFNKETIFMHRNALNVFPAKLRMYVLCMAFVLGIYSLTIGYFELQKKKMDFAHNTRPHKNKEKCKIVVGKKPSGFVRFIIQCLIGCVYDM